MKRMIVVIPALLLSFAVLAIDTGKAFDDPEMQARYERIIEEVRCLKCQNQALKDSNALLAEDLRREIRLMLSDGKTDAEIFDFLVTRYGEFALYRPRMRGKTLVLWIAPIVLLGAGALVAMSVIRGRMSMPNDDDAEERAS